MHIRQPTDAVEYERGSKGLFLAPGSLSWLPARTFGRRITRRRPDCPHNPQPVADFISSGQPMAMVRGLLCPLTLTRIVSPLWTTQARAGCPAFEDTQTPSRCLKHQGEDRSDADRIQRKQRQPQRGPSSLVLAIKMTFPQPVIPGIIGFDSDMCILSSPAVLRQRQKFREGRGFSSISCSPWWPFSSL